MGIFFRSKLPDRTVDSFQEAIARAAAMAPTENPASVLKLAAAALANAPAADELDWRRMGLVLGFLAVLAGIGLVEYNLGKAVAGDRFFSWAEKVFTVVLGLITGEAAGRKS
jgi:hypothetical protein